MSDLPQPPHQLELPLFESAAPTVRPGLRVIQGGRQRRQEALASRDAVIRVLVETGADLLLRRISSVRAEQIQRDIDRILDLFDRVDRKPELMPVLQRQLEQLEELMAETRQVRRQHTR